MVKFKHEITVQDLQDIYSHESELYGDSWKYKLMVDSPSVESRRADYLNNDMILRALLSHQFMVGSKVSPIMFFGRLKQIPRDSFARAISGAIISLFVGSDWKFIFWNQQELEYHELVCKNISGDAEDCMFGHYSISQRDMVSGLPPSQENIWLDYCANCRKTFIDGWRIPKICPKLDTAITVGSGCTVFARPGYPVSNCTVYAGGTLIIESEGLADIVTVHPGGRCIVSSGGTFVGGDVAGWITVHGSARCLEAIGSTARVFVTSGGIVGTAVCNECSGLHVSSGGFVNSAVMDGRSMLHVTSGAHVSRAEIKNNGVLELYDGAHVAHITLSSTGRMHQVGGKATIKTIEVQQDMWTARDGL